MQNEPTPRVLVIEDDVDQAALTERILSAGCGADVTVVDSAEDAHRLLPRLELDCIWTDVHLPGRSGLELVSDARRVWPDLPVGVMTAHTEGDLALMALRAHVNAYVTKPFSAKNLLSQTQRMVNSRRRLLQRPMARPRRTVLAIGAHPDDVEIGCGGTLLRHRQAGDRVVVVTLTGGEAGGSTQMRGEEARDAASLLDAELHHLDLPDTQVSITGALAGLEPIVRSLRPDVIYTHSSHDVHQDHRAVHEATLIAGRSVADVCCYQSPSATIAFVPSTFVDVEPFLADKLRLIECYGSQTVKCAYLAPELIQATARYWGRFQGHGWVEPFEVVRSSGVGMQPQPVSAH